MDAAAVLNVVIWVTATVATAVGTWFVSRRGSKSTFLSDVLKENEYLKARLHALDNDNLALNEQNRMLGQENTRLVRQEHKEVLGRLESLITRSEVSRTGASGTDTKLKEIHDLVDDRLDRALAEIADMRRQLGREGND